MELAKALNLGVHLVHAQPEKPSTPTAVIHNQATDPSLGREMMKEIKGLNSLKSDFEEAGIECSFATPAGKTSEVIVLEAHRVQAPYIVLGSHGNGAMYHLVVGSVAEGIMKKLDTPVILVPAQQRLE
jgi:nucleotide-binding universal stress UspA family protein